jgi:subtilisin family serine protease
VARTIADVHVVVAAVGKDGPAAPPLYPSAYPGVVGVTGVDSRDRVLVEAGRGAQVDFAAPGVWEIDGRRARGTSYAAPVVAGVLAARMTAPGGAARALAALQQDARDLGARGRDDVYGYGLVRSGAAASASR